MSPESPVALSKKTLGHRARLPGTLTHVFPYETNRLSQGIMRAEALLRQDPPYGVIVAFNHYSLRDFVDLARALSASSIIRERPVLIPIARHQYTPVTAKAGEYLGVSFAPIVIRDTHKYARYRNLPLGAGLPEYIASAAHVLTEGGVVPLSLQEGRRPRLGRPEVPTLGFFLKHMARKNVERIAVVFAGLSLPGETNYRRQGVNLLNPFRKTCVQFGEAYIVSEAYDQAKSSGLTIDEWAYTRLMPLVPKVYW